MNPIPDNSSSQNSSLNAMDDEISLLEIFEILKDQWRWIAALTLAAPITALLVSLGIPELYQAEALLQIGRAPVSGSGSGSGSGYANIEPVSDLIQRINNESFEKKIRQQIDASLELNALELKKSTLIKVEGRASSVEKARAGVSLAIKQIQQDHDEILVSTKKSLEESLRNTLNEIRSVAASQEQLTKTILAISPARQDPLSALLLTQTQNQLTQQRTDLLNRKAQLEFSISPQNLQPTRAVEEIYSQDQPVFPKTRMIVPISALGGLFMGILLAFLRHAVKAMGNKRKNL